MGKVFISFEAFSYSFFRKVATKIGKWELEGARKFRVTISFHFNSPSCGEEADNFLVHISISGFIEANGKAAFFLNQAEDCSW